MLLRRNRIDTRFRSVILIKAADRSQRNNSLEIRIQCDAIALVNRIQSPLSMLPSTPSTRMIRPQRLHSNACASDNRIKPLQVGHGTSWSVLIAATRTALPLRLERSRGPSRRNAAMTECPLFDEPNSVFCSGGRRLFATIAPAP
jgi:hypothetical protein